MQKYSRNNSKINEPNMCNCGISGGDNFTKRVITLLQNYKKYPSRACVG